MAVKKGEELTRCESCYKNFKRKDMTMYRKGNIYLPICKTCKKKPEIQHITKKLGYKPTYGSVKEDVTTEAISRHLIKPGKFKSRGGEIITVHSIEKDGKRALVSGDDKKKSPIDIDALKYVLVKPVKEAVSGPAGLQAQVSKMSKDKLLKLFNQMKDERLSASAAVQFKAVRRELSKRGVSLKEGTWHLPASPKEIAQLKNLLSKPLPAKGATKKLYGLLGDDDLFDHIDDAEAKVGPKTDVRHLVKSKIKELVKKSPKRFKDPTDLVRLKQIGESITISEGDRASLKLGGFIKIREIVGDVAKFSVTDSMGTPIGVPHSMKLDILEPRVSHILEGVRRQPTSKVKTGAGVKYGDMKTWTTKIAGGIKSWKVRGFLHTPTTKGGVRVTFETPEGKVVTQELGAKAGKDWKVDDVFIKNKDLFATFLTPEDKK